MLKTEDKKNLKEQDYAALNSRQEKNRIFNRVRRSLTHVEHSQTLECLIVLSSLLKFYLARCSRSFLRG